MPRSGEVESRISIASTRLRPTEGTVTALLSRRQRSFPDTVRVAGLGTSALLQRHSTTRLRSENESLAEELTEAQTTQARLRAGQSALDEELAGLRKQHSELLRLRDEVTRLRAAQRGQPRPEAAVPQTADQAPENQQVTIEAKFTELPASTLKKIAVEAMVHPGSLYLT